MLMLMLMLVVVTRTIGYFQNKYCLEFAPLNCLNLIINQCSNMHASIELAEKCTLCHA